MTTFHDIVRRPYLLGRWILPMALVLGACGGDGGSEADDDSNDPSDTTGDDVNGGGGGDNGGGSGDDGGPGDVPAPPDSGPDEPPPPPCDEARMTAVQTSIDDAIPKEIDAVAFVKEPSCGERYFTHGPSKYPATTGHLIASNTKTYVASLILLLADDGLLKLDDPISKWIDKVPGGDAITVRQTLNHSSGIYNYTEDFVFGAQVQFGKKYTPEELIDIGFKGKTYFAPGKGFHYSNTNYIILGRIAEKVAKLPLEQVLRTRILEPIGATSTFLNGKENVTIDVAVGKSATGGTAAKWDPSSAWAAGAYIATPQDLGRWAEVRANGTFHTKAAHDALLDAIETTAAEVRYGAGIFVLDPSVTNGGGVGVGHGGDIPGYHSWSLYFPDKKTALAIVVDSDKSPPGAPGGTYSGTMRNAVLKPLFANGGATP